MRRASSSSRQSPAPWARETVQVFERGCVYLKCGARRFALARVSKRRSNHQWEIGTPPRAPHRSRCPRRRRRTPTVSAKASPRRARGSARTTRTNRSSGFRATAARHTCCEVGSGALAHSGGEELRESARDMRRHARGLLPASSRHHQPFDPGRRQGRTVMGAGPPVGSSRRSATGRSVRGLAAAGAGGGALHLRWRC
jgi:hypothetical protein